MLPTPALRTYRRQPGVLRLQADVCVVGSGMAGVSAALESARLGRRVLLVEAGTALGGQAVGSMIGTLCGLYANGPNPRQVTRGIADDILRHLAAHGGHWMHGRRNTTIVQYQVPVLARWVEDAVAAAGVQVLLGAVLRGVRRDGRRLLSAAIATRHGDVEVEAASWVDASGDAALAWAAGLQVSESTAPVFGTTMFTLAGVDEAALAALDRAELRAAVASRAAAHGLLRHDGFAFAHPAAGEVLVNMTHIETPLDPLGASAAVGAGRAQVDRLVDVLRTAFPSVFGQAMVRAYGLPGVRQTRTVVGAYRLAAADVREGRRFPDAVARCSWPIEFHGEAAEAHWEVFGDGHMHTVPLRSLAPAEADNLMAAGRCLDADPVALSSVRVMGTCIATGAAAAHALDLAGAGSVHQVDVAALQERLRANLGDG